MRIDEAQRPQWVACRDPACARLRGSVRLPAVSTTDETRRQRRLGTGVYSRASLLFYDVGVLAASNRIVWRCPSSRIMALYQANVAASHLDVGVGTGYFLDRVEFPVGRPRVGLLDLNGNSLTHTARRLIRYSPEIYRADVLAPIAIEIEPFESIGLNYLLHCLPGPMAAKAAAFDNLRPLLKPGGTIFGGTVLRRIPKLPRAARAFMAVYNAMGIFDNLSDSLDGLHDALSARFEDVQIETYGAVALFRARVDG
jgi:SAM-dependent methyltransferase